METETVETDVGVVEEEMIDAEDFIGDTNKDSREEHWTIVE